MSVRVTNGRCVSSHREDRGSVNPSAPWSSVELKEMNEGL